uniref:DNA-directed RNA polymerase subunit n=1 Tax=Meloidogyne incognita TaxID=6306 RepID=A0A914M661_MELIC
MGKEQFKEADTSRKVIGVKFTAGNTELIRQAAHIQIFNNRLYEDVQGKWLPAQYGPLDSRLGTFQKSLNCQTCNKNMNDCVGHFGFIDLEYPVFHVGFFRLIIQTLQCICKGCSQTLLQEEQKSLLLRQASNPNLDYLRKKALQKKIVTLSKKISMCTKCGFLNGVVKKAVGSVLKIAHHEPLSAEILAAVEDRNELQQLLSSSKQNLLDPLKVMEIFKRIDLKDLPLLMIGADECKHPLHFLNQRIPVPPVCIRPSVVSELKSGSNEDDITMKLTEIMLINDILKKHKKDGAPMKTICETWDHLQVQCALYINSEMSGLPPEMQPKKFLRSFAQRLKGKHGRFRGNLSGKRVDFTARTVISPDPNLKIDQVGVPLQVAMTLTFPEVVCRSNIERLRKAVINGELVHPGANQIIDCKTGNKRSLRYGNRAITAKNLQIGDIVERHLSDGDVVLFNRQPSLHKISIMSHRVKVMPYRTFRFNECACTPYNADFDGDEMNVHFPQTYEAKAESSLLMGVKHNLVSPRAGQPLIAAIQDFITAGHLLTKKDTFLTHSEVQRISATLLDITEINQRKIRLPPPAIIWPIKLWTGKQLIELVIAPFVDSNVRLNLSTKNKIHNPDDGEFTHKDTFVIIRNNQLLCGSLDKTLLGSESKTSIFYTLLRDWGEQHAIDAMWRLARFSGVYLSNRGFSIGIGDVRPNQDVVLFNRQPSLHKISIMSHRVKVMPYRTFRFNECACTPYNADFDGDEMNVHFPQTYEAKAESSLLMGVKHNLVSPRAGQPLIAAIQDFITAGHLLTKKDTFLTHSEVQRISATLLDITEINQRKIRLPPPAIIWPIKLWTGKQLIELVIAPFVDSNVRLNLSTKNKIHNPDDGEFTHKDTFVIIRNNQLLCGSLDKTLLGSESKTSIFYTLLRDWGEQHAIDAMWRLARFSGVYLSNRGFSIGIGDVRPNQQLLDEKRILLENGYKTCDQLNKTMKMEKQKTKPDFGLVEELEAKILKELSNIRDQAGKACREFLSKNNTPLTMAQCGSKGSFINIAQMIALVGQQSISGKRPSDGFEAIFQ